MSDLALTDHGTKLTAEVEGLELRIDYGWLRDGVMRVDFVEVPRKLNGRGLGTKLVGALVDKARAEDFRLVPVCGFARTQLARHPAWQGVLA
ncbi:MAG: N-acetyltransferase [Hyphomonadaceae bacterium]|nr:N-acetyltransferase [Hyphomonadaceae bacterium]